tara:strand:- start:12117 stop:12536 length:420 start_codon:yes stop_codon:yes gene_type:complete
MNRLISILLFLILVFITPNQINASTNELPECIVITHCVREDFKVKDLENAFRKAKKIVLETPRTKIVEQTNTYIHAEAKTKWRRYTDDLLIKAIPEKEIIQVRSESRVGIGDNGVNQRRIDDLAYRLMTEPDISSNFQN